MIKKLFLVFFLILMYLSSCGQNSSTYNIDDTSQTEKPTVESAFKTPEKPMREWVVDYMYQMASVKWIPMRDMDLTKDAGGHPVGNTLFFKQGEVYHGMPYVSLSTNSDLDDFLSVLIWDQEDNIYYYDCPPDRNGELVKGNQCSSAPLCAIKRFDTTVKANGTGDCLPLTGINGIYPVGNFKTDWTDLSTRKIINKNDENTIYEAYALLQKGDMVLRFTDSGHMRMAVEVYVERNQSGKILRDRSYVKTIEQTNTMDSTRTDGVKTTWFVDHIYTFNQLREQLYIPITCKALAKDNPAPVITVTNANTEKNIGVAKSLMGTLDSNYSFLGVGAYINNQNGETVYSVYKDIHFTEMSGTFSLEKLNFNFDMTSLNPGKYTYNIIAETVCGKGEVYSVEFTK